MRTIGLVAAAVVLLSGPLAAQAPDSLEWVAVPSIFTVARGITRLRVSVMGPFVLTDVHAYEAPGSTPFPYPRWRQAAPD